MTGLLAGLPARMDGERILCAEAEIADEARTPPNAVRQLPLGAQRLDAGRGRDPPQSARRASCSAPRAAPGKPPAQQRLGQLSSVCGKSSWIGRRESGLALLTRMNCSCSGKSRSTGIQISPGWAPLSRARPVGSKETLSSKAITSDRKHAYSEERDRWRGMRP